MLRDNLVQRMLRWKGRPQRGQSLVIVAMAMVGIIAAVGLAVDTGIIFLYRTWLSQAVDAASLAAAVELPNVKGACARAVEYMVENGYNAGDEFSYRIQFPAAGGVGALLIDSDADFRSAGLDPNDPASCNAVNTVGHEDVHFKVGVAGSQEVPVSFMRLLGFDRVDIGFPAVAERADHFDIALVLDVSGSMSFDSCGVRRALAFNEEGYSQYGCFNRYLTHACTTVPGTHSGFDADLEGWSAAGGARFNGDHVRISGGDGEINKVLDIAGAKNLTVYFDLNVQNWRPSGKVIVGYSLDDGASWIPLSTFDQSYWNADPFKYNLGGGWVRYGIVLPTEAETRNKLGIRFYTTDLRGSMTASIDNVELENCPRARQGYENLAATLEYKQEKWRSGNYLHLCPNLGYTFHITDQHPGTDPPSAPPLSPESCHLQAPQTLLPMESIDGDKPPVRRLLQQPMYDVLVSSKHFLDILESRPSAGVRQDMVGLARFSSTAERIEPLTYDFNLIRAKLFEEFFANGSTNLGGGIREGLEILSYGRPSSTHFMVLLTDGVPNKYKIDSSCPTDLPCPETLRFIEDWTAEAYRANVTIFTIGLGDQIGDLDMAADPGQVFNNPGVFPEVIPPSKTQINGAILLDAIATSTDGTFYHARTPEELDQIFRWIAEAIFVRLAE